MEEGPALSTAGCSPHLGDPQHTPVHPLKSAAVKSHKSVHSVLSEPRFQRPPRLGEGVVHTCPQGSPLWVRNRHSCRALLRGASCPQGGHAFCPVASTRGQGRRTRPVMVCSSPWVKHPPSAGRENAFKAVFQVRFHLQKPSDRRWGLDPVNLSPYPTGSARARTRAPPAAQPRSHLSSAEAGCTRALSPLYLSRSKSKML